MNRHCRISGTQTIQSDCTGHIHALHKGVVRVLGASRSLEKKLLQLFFFWGVECHTCENVRLPAVFGVSLTMNGTTSEALVLHGLVECADVNGSLDLTSSM